MESYLLCHVKRIKDIVPMILEEPSFPDLSLAFEVGRTVSEVISIERNHLGPVAGVRATSNAAWQCVHKHGITTNVQICI